jgi:hypothetical protein
VVKELSTSHVPHFTSEDATHPLGELAALRGEPRPGQEAQVLGRHLKEEAEARRVVGARVPDAPFPLAHEVRVDPGRGLLQQRGQFLQAGRDVVLLPAAHQTL